VSEILHKGTATPLPSGVWLWLKNLNKGYEGRPLVEVTLSLLQW